MNVWEVCEFNEDIKYGRLELNKFAVELYDVINGEADDVYKDPKRFLSNTYLTDTMKQILIEALKRLTSGEGQPVYVIDTEFGGGKTHTLLLLYHIFKNSEVGSDYIKQYGIDKETNILEVPQVRVVAIDCRKVEKNTLWGELADKLGRYEAFKAEDLERKPIYDIGRITALLDRPTLILIDELPDYLLKTSGEKVGSTTLSDLTMAFMVNLVSAVNSSKNSMLIITLTAKQRLYTEYTDKFKDRLRDSSQKTLTNYKREEVYDKSRGLFSRQARYVTPVKNEEIAKVIKRRLIKQISKEDMVKDIANKYYKYYVDKGIIQDPVYKERLETSYPFHPFLIDVLYERVSTIDDFNKTRGILRLLAMVLHRIARDRPECKIVSTGDIPLDDKDVNDELTAKLGKADLKPVIEADCKGKAKEIDRKRNVKIAEKIARTIYLYSLIGSSKISGIRVSDLKLAVCQPGIDPTLVEDVLAEIDNSFWYLKEEEGTYYFDKEPNINKIIYDYMKEVQYDEAIKEIRNTLESLMKVDGIVSIIWDREKLEDKYENIRFFVVPLDYTDKGYIEGILHETNTGNIRNYKNTIAFILPNKEYEDVDRLIYSAKLYCAIDKVKKSDRFKVDKNRLKEIDERLNNAKDNLRAECQYVYSKVAYTRVESGELEIDDLPIDTKSTLGVAVKSFLANKGKLLERLNSDVILDIMNEGGGWEREKKDKINKIKVEDIYLRFRKDIRKPFILRAEVIIDAVKEGVSKGSFVYVNEQDGKYVRSNDIDWEGFIVSKDAIKELDSSGTNIDVYSDNRIGSGIATGLTESISRNTLDSVRSASSIYDTREPIYKYKYRIESKSLDKIISDINRLGVIIIGKEDVDITLDITARNDKDDEITIKSKFKNREEIKSILTLLKRNWSGSGHFIINAKEDLSEEFKKQGVEWVV